MDGLRIRKSRSSSAAGPGVKKKKILMCLVISFWGAIAPFIPSILREIGEKRSMGEVEGRRDEDFREAGRRNGMGCWKEGRKRVLAEKVPKCRKG
jgi:hypothetical protein